MWTSPDITLRKMTDCIVHRGPNDSGEWLDIENGLAFGFRRLSILDLSQAGHQPMVSESGRYVIVFNGEIYNYTEIQSELGASASNLRGRSDTEVLLAAIDKWGIQKAIEHAVGMFAIAVWDRQEKLLHLIRDRLGEKPLYFGLVDGNLLFGSELKALRSFPAWNAEIDRSSLALFLRHNYVPAPYSIYKGINKVLPGTIVTFSAGNLEDFQVSKYWSALEVARQGVNNPLPGSDDDVIELLESLLRETIYNKMIADVPLGAFLSGGVDSSLLVALMQAQSTQPVRTFTIGFNEAAFNEAEHAKAVAKHLGTQHTELYITPEETLSVIPKLPEIYDEPFADSSQIPTYLVAKLAREHVTVSLSGEGGDELFGGYNRYFWGERIWNKLDRIPNPLRTAGGRLLKSISPDRLDKTVAAMESILPSKYHVVNPGDKIHKVASILGARSSDELYRLSMTHWPNPEEIANAKEYPTILNQEGAGEGLKNPILRMMYFDLVTEMPDDILVKVDRASMAVSLETRAPFLDHRVVEFAWRVPLHQKLRDGRGKWILRELLYRYVPSSLIDRPKMGFGVPIDTWLRGPLKSWALDLLSPQRLKKDGYLEPQQVTLALEEHLSGQRNHSHQLWGLLMFQSWLDHQER